MSIIFNNESLISFIIIARDFLWSGPVLAVLFIVGIYQTFKIKGLQFYGLARSFKLIVNPKSCQVADPKITKAASSKKSLKNKGDISAFQALMTALAGAIGTGNITGIATAVAVGGFGSLFWMWLMSCFGMATAYSETLLSIKFRKTNSLGDMSGGPMYTLFYGMNSPVLAGVFAVFAAIAAIGIGCLAQSNSVVDAIVEVFPGNRLIFGSVLAIITGGVIIGGVKSIGRVAGVLVPFMAAIYLLVGLFILFVHFDRLPGAFSLIISSAFTGQAAVGGFVGSTLMLALQNGVQFGVFANEAGLGSLGIAAASAKTSQPVEQAMRSMGGVFFATMIVCTLTGLVLAVTDVLGTVNVNNGVLIKGSPLAMAAFGSVHQGFRYVVMGGLGLFAFTTMLAWAYYGEKSIEYLLGIRAGKVYRWIFTIAVIAGAVLELETVWAIANVAAGLMAFPNLISIIYLSNIVKEETIKYFGLKEVNLKLKFL